MLRRACRVGALASLTPFRSYCRLPKSGGLIDAGCSPGRLIGPGGAWCARRGLVPVDCEASSSRLAPVLAQGLCGCRSRPGRESERIMGIGARMLIGLFALGLWAAAADAA